MVMFNGNFADNCAEIFPVSMGGRAEVKRAKTMERGPQSAPAEFISSCSECICNILQL